MSSFAGESRQTWNSSDQVRPTRPSLINHTPPVPEALTRPGAWVALNRGATEANNWNIKTFDFLISRGWDVNYYWGHHGDIIG